MTEATHSTLGSGLTWRGQAAVTWRYLDSLPQGHALSHLNQCAENSLRQLAQIDEAPQETGEENPGIARELERLENMVGLLIHLVGKVLAQQLQVPDPVPVALSPEGLEWGGGELPQAGRAVLVQLFLHADIPQPLELAGETMPGTEVNRVAVNFYGVSEHTREWLEKTVFRFHRRNIAHQRGHRE